jgi:hypothetical protein
VFDEVTSYCWCFEPTVTGSGPQRDLPGRSKMGRDELARKLGEN